MQLQGQLRTLVDFGFISIPEMDLPEPMEIRQVGSPLGHDGEWEA